jgi:hypothetical protein
MPIYRLCWEKVLWDLEKLRGVGVFEGCIGILAENIRPLLHWFRLRLISSAHSLLTVFPIRSFLRILLFT